ncbi:hypothetical protein CTP10_R44680 [Cupriavidus sp. P-10]|uniref:hypothetical protein n=1 Tax=unclassified Cupriavidus TaxID=2640874 RepID=UPI000E2FB883|nr:MULTISPECIES: hypothetical protein [unclassified Cupriavidus]BDB27063.1 hypothetical protein CTP10_R44680 [Cupriavidus sp. P-10]
MERKHCLAWIALSMIAATLLTLLCLILDDHAETRAATRVRQMEVRVGAQPSSPADAPRPATSERRPGS